MKFIKCDLFPIIITFQKHSYWILTPNFSRSSIDFSTSIEFATFSKIIVIVFLIANPEAKNNKGRVVFFDHGATNTSV
jgi:hypothetical protein